ncbi:MAG: bifunctional N-acetylglucosamine-1-phosphate uridyltransferase/glucosamine-1-phosphate acetyltransferase [Candidatus Riflebacteria bacterium]|nr:bifunctional N-acetylglucosamine-1-phosphate uridyltransferase/glucosamine-1-phosphate acetyltransferase [Candidatus Riflebacteria bacterium]
MQNIHALVLAAGKGVRMKSALPKVMHPVLGKPMVMYVIDACRFAGASEVHVVTGFGRDVLEKSLRNENVKFVVQADQLGTGHAVQCYAKDQTVAPENLLIVCGDTPLLSRTTLQQLREKHFSTQADLTMMTLNMQEPGLYGRIIRNEQGKITGIREAKDCDADQLKIREINLAVYMFNGKELFERLFKIKNNNRQKEYYLTDLVEMFHNDGLKIESVIESDETSTLGINSRVDLALINGIMKQQVLKKHLENGVTIVDTLQTLIEPDVEILPETVIQPGTMITGKTRIGSGCEIGPNTMIASSVLGNNVKAPFCMITGSSFSDNVSFEPFSHIENTNSGKIHGGKK